MPSRAPSVVARYALTLLVLTMATALRFALTPVLDQTVPFILFFPAVVLCAWFGGLWPGLVSAVVGGLIAWYVFIPPAYSFKVSDRTAPAQLIVFLTAGALISFLAESLHRARRKTEESEAREREERQRLRVTLASIGDAVITTDDRGRVTFMNHVAESLTGWKQEEASGQPLETVFRIVNDGTRTPVENPALRAMREGVITGLANHTILLTRNGAEYPIDDSGAPIRDLEGRTVGAVLVFRDISERRKAEGELRRSKEELLEHREQLRMAMEGSQMGTWTRELDESNRTRWSPELERIFGLNPGEFPETEEAFFDFVHPDDRPPLIAAVGDAIRNHTDYTIEFRYTRKGDTATRWMLGRGRAFYDAGGKPVRLAGFGWDITDRKQAEEALRQQREWFRVTLASIGDAVVTTGTDGLISFLNPVAESLTGWTEEQAVGQPLEKVFRIVNEQTRATVENPALRAMREGRIVGLANHTMLIAKDGTEIPIDDSGAPIKDAGGNTLGAVLTFRDISERRMAEDRFRLSVESAPNSMIMADEDGRIILVNSQTEKLFGYSRDELIGQKVEMLVPERFRRTHPGHRASFTAAPEARPMGVGRDLYGLRRDGSEVPIEIGLNPIRVREKTVILSSIVDISARKLAERERAALLAGERAAREHAETASRAKDEFVAMVSHELRGPLTAILGWSQLLRSGKFDPAEMTHALETLERNAKAEAQLIEDLLDISRAITGKLVLNVHPVEIRPSIENAVDAVRAAALAKSIDLAVHLGARRTWISGDPARLQQIVWNLLSNAVKFTPQDGRVEVRVEQSDSLAHIVVRDSGIGINPEFLPRVFERFSQAQSGSERKHGGLGLGLAIVRHLVELHGGTVRAESPGEGLGATFTVTLPLTRVHDELPDLGATRAAPLEARALEGVRVMIVDDHADTREFLTEVLRGYGAEIRACASAAEALEAIGRWQPSVLLSDVAMPNEDGYSLVRRLRELAPEGSGSIPAVALTAFAKSEDRMRALAAGFQTHITKPVEPVELATVIASLTGRTGKRPAV